MWVLLIYVKIFQVQKQLQMRIEAQGKYLQKIIEEQQKLGSTLRSTETVSSPQDKQDPSQSEPSGDASAGTLSPHKRPRMDEGSKDGFTGSQSPTKTAQKTDIDVGQLDPNLYADDAEFNLTRKQNARRMEIRRESVKN